jgi:hypothetical protein
VESRAKGVITKSKNKWKNAKHRNITVSGFIVAD